MSDRLRYRPVLAAVAVLLLVPPREALAKDKGLPGWSCSLRTQAGRFYWSVNETTGAMWGNDLYWEAKAGPFFLTTLYRLDDRRTGKVTPRTLEVVWGGNQGTTSMRIELTDPGAEKWDDPIEASSWFANEPMNLVLGWKEVRQLSTDFPDMVVSVRDRANKVMDTQSFPTTAVAPPQDEVRKALLEMARLSANFKQSDQCQYEEELMEIVIG